MFDGQWLGKAEYEGPFEMGAGCLLLVPSEDNVVIIKSIVARELSEGLHSIEKEVTSNLLDGLNLT